MVVGNDDWPGHPISGVEPKTSSNGRAAFDSLFFRKVSVTLRKGFSACTLSFFHLC